MELNGPLNVHWEMTNVCNLRCVHCYQQDDGARAGLPSSEILWRIAKKITQAGVFELTVTGGEPLLVPELVPLIRYFNKSSIRPHVTSNGMLVTDQTADVLAELDLTFQISIDSGNALKHNEIRRSSRAFTRAVEGARRLASRSVSVSFSYTAMPGNEEDLEAVVHLADDVGIDRVCVGEVMPYFGTADRRQDLTPATEGMAHFVAALKHAQNAAQRVKVVPALMSGHLFDPTLTKSSCTALDRDLAILHDGWAYPCPFVRSSKYRMGNVLTSSIEEIWQGPAARAFRAEKEVGPKHCTRDSSEPTLLKIGRRHDLSQEEF